MNLIGQSALFTFFLLSFPLSGLAITMEPALPQEGVMSPDVNDGMDQTLDYGSFTGRVSDKDDAGRVFKVKAENNNAKFFRAGDTLYFRVQQHGDRDKCKAFVRNVEDFYFTMYVENLAPCWVKDQYFPRGMVLVFDSPVLADRVFEASKYRDTLILRKEDYLKQLNGINHFLWTFDQQKIKVAADYDARILELERQKQSALDDLITQKQEQINLQTTLQSKLTEMDESLKFYRVERQELITDRWNMDHDMALPVGQRPQEMKKR